MQITPEQFETAYRKLPYPIKEFIAGVELGKIVLAVGKTYNLHVDTIGALERETTNMLLGLINPEQFVAELKSAGIPQESIPNIVADLNAKIFVPLREKMRNPAPEESESSDDEDDDVPSVATPPVAPVTPIAQPIAQAPTPFPSGLPIAPAPQIIQAVPAATPPAQPPVAPPIASAPIVPVTPPSSVSQFSPASMPTPSTPLPQPKIQSQQTQNRDDLHAVLKEYGIDPYREPAE